MTGTTEKKTPPRDDAEWARDITQRVEDAEHPTSLRCGDWVFSTSPDGNLIASHRNGGSVVVARPPASGEQDPDAIDDATVAAVTVLRSAPQSIAAAGTQVIWDGVRLETGGSWTGGRTVLDAVTVPVDGIYLVTGTIHWSTGGAFLTSVVMVDGQTTLAGRVEDSAGGVWLTSTATGLLQLQAGQSVGLLAYANAARTIGAATLYGTAVPCELSLALQERIQ